MGFRELLGRIGRTTASPFSSAPSPMAPWGGVEGPGGDSGGGDPGGVGGYLGGEALVTLTPTSPASMKSGQASGSPSAGSMMKRSASDQGLLRATGGVICAQENSPPFTRLHCKDGALLDSGRYRNYLVGNGMPVQSWGSPVGPKMKREMTKESLACG